MLCPKCKTSEMEPKVDVRDPDVTTWVCTKCGHEMSVEFERDKETDPYG